MPCPLPLRSHLPVDRTSLRLFERGTAGQGGVEAAQGVRQAWGEADTESWLGPWSEAPRAGKETTQSKPSASVNISRHGRLSPAPPILTHAHKASLFLNHHQRGAPLAALGDSVSSPAPPVTCGSQGLGRKSWARRDASRALGTLLDL